MASSALIQRVNIERDVVALARTIEQETLGRYLKRDISDLVVKHKFKSPQLIAPQLRRLATLYSDAKKLQLLGLADEFDVAATMTSLPHGESLIVDVAAIQSDGKCFGTFLVYNYQMCENHPVVNMLMIHSEHQVSVDHSQMLIETGSALLIALLIPGFGIAEAIAMLAPLATIGYEAYKSKQAITELKAKALLLKSLESKGLIAFSGDDEAHLLLH